MRTLLSPVENITTSQIIDAIKAGFPVMVVINGEYYQYNPETDENTNSKQKEQKV